MHVWHSHRYPENVFLRVEHRDGIVDCGARGRAANEQDPQCALREPFPVSPLRIILKSSLPRRRVPAACPRTFHTSRRSCHWTSPEQDRRVKSWRQGIRQSRRPSPFPRLFGRRREPLFSKRAPGQTLPHRRKRLARFTAPQDRHVRRGKSSRESFEHFSPHGVRTRLENGPEAPPRPAIPRGLNRYADCSGMMRKIIHHENARGLTLSSSLRRTP